MDFVPATKKMTKTVSNFFVVVVQTNSCDVAQAGFELSVILPPQPTRAVLHPSLGIRSPTTALICMKVWIWLQGRSISGLNILWCFPSWDQACFRQVIPSPFNISPLGMTMSILCFSPHCIWKHKHSFHRLTVGRNLPQNESCMDLTFV